jgi:hypothetical protein
MKGEKKNATLDGCCPIVSLIQSLINLPVACAEEPNPHIGPSLRMLAEVK